MAASDTNTPPLNGQGRTMLELTVRNHPGVMSHVSGMFSRRSFNVEGILCLPTGDGTRSTIWLLVQEDARLDQMVAQLNKLVDVLEVARRGPSRRDFARLSDLFSPSGESPAGAQ